MKKVNAIVIGLILLFNGLAAPTVMAAGNPLEQGYVEGYLKNIIITPDASATDPTAAPASARATRSRSQTPAAPVATTTSLVIEDYDGAVYQLKLSPAASLSIDQIPARISDFRPGIEVYGELHGSEIVLLEGITAALGYIASGSQTRQGTIKAIDRDQIQLVMANGEITTVYTTAATVVQRNGQSVTLSSIFVGDRVKVYFDDSGSNTVGRMQVEGPSVEIKDIYRGTLQAADGRGYDYSQGVKT
jgi:Cu/Ag efflux protein CusF